MCARRIFCWSSDANDMSTGDGYTRAESRDNYEMHGQEPNKTRLLSATRFERRAKVWAHDRPWRSTKANTSVRPGMTDREANFNSHSHFVYCPIPTKCSLAGRGPMLRKAKTSPSFCFEYRNSQKLMVWCEISICSGPTPKCQIKSLEKDDVKMLEMLCV